MKHLFFKKWLALFMIATFLFGGSFFNVALAEELSQPIITETPAVETSATEVTQTVEPTALTPISEPEIIAPTTEVVTPAVTETTVEITKTETADSTQAILEPEVIPAVENTAPVVTESIPETTAIEEIIATETAATLIVVPTLPKEIWTNSGSKTTTNNPVELNTTYTAPQNDQVTVTFTKLPETPGTLSIEEITLTPEQVTSLGALSDKAYDITSDMIDGTFAFVLNLPKPVNQENVQIKFAEDVVGLKNADTVATCDLTIENDSVSASLDHFTYYFVAAIAPVLTPVISTITLSNLQGWVGVDDNGQGGSLTFVNGPTGSLGLGSAQLSLNATGQGYMLYKPAYGGIKLSNITNLSYNTFVKQGNNTIAPALQFDITKDVDNDTSWQGRLVYEPYQNGHASVIDGQWQTQNALNGIWWLSRSDKFENHCSMSNPCTFSELTALYPNIGIRNANGGGVGFKAGSGWVDFVGNVDNFTFNNDTYDFESTPVVTAQDFATWDSSPSFKAINVGFKTDNFSHIDAVKVTLQKNGLDIVSNTASVAMLNAINSQTSGFTQNGQLSTPFIVSGELVDTYCAGGPCWIAGTHNWLHSEKPDLVVITVTENGKEYTVTNMNLSEATATFDSLITPDTTPPTIDNPIITNNALWGSSYNILNLPNHLSEATNLPVIGGIVQVGANFNDDMLLTNVVALLPGKGFFVKDSNWAGVSVGLHTVTWNTKASTWQGVPDGNYIFTFNAKDGGNGQNQLQNSATKEIPVTVDNTGPTVAFTSNTPNENKIVKGIITVEGNFTDANGLMNTDIGIHNDGRIGEGWKCHTDWPTQDTKTCVINTTELNDGTYKLTMAGRDKAGNITQVFRTIIIDNIAPSVNFISPTPEENTYVRGTIKAHVQATDNIGMGSYYIRVWKDSFESGSSNLVYNGCSSAPGATALGISKDVTCSIDVSSWSNGTYVMSAQFLDGGSNWGKALRIIYVDNTAPTSVNDLSDLVRSTVNVTQIISDNFSPVSGKLRIWKLGLNGAQDNTKFFAIGDVVVDINNKVVYTINTLSNLFGDGQYVAKFTSTDAAGNQSVVNKNFTVDNTAPNADVTVPLVGDYVRGTIDITGVFSDNNHEFNSIYIGFTGNDKNGTQLSWCHSEAPGFGIADGTRTCSFDTTKLSDGPHKIEIWAMDKAGNWGTGSNQSIDVIVDNTLLMPVHESPANESFINHNDFWFDWSDVSGAVSYEIQNSTNLAIDSNGSFQNVMWIGDYQNIQPTNSIARSVGASGTWYWQVRAVDAAGNKSAWTAPWGITIDTTAPVGGTLTMKTKLFPNGVTATLANNVYTITPALSLDGADVFQSLSVVVTDDNIDTSNAPVYIDGNSETNGYMQYDSSTQVWNYTGQTTRPDFSVETQHTLSATFKDLAGNQTTLTANFTTDNTAPIITLTGAIPDITVGGVYTELGATTTDGSVVITTGFVDTSLAGSYNVTYNSTDAAGNIATPVIRTVNVVIPIVEKIIKTLESVILNSGSGYTPSTPCSSVTYGEWGSAVNGIQERGILSRTPNSCSFTSEQILGASRIVPSPVTQQVLGVKVYANGTLLKGNNNRIYVVIDNKLQYISSLRELIKYRGPILKVSDEVIASFLYTDGTLIRAKGDNKIYVIKDGKKVHIKSLAELRKQKGKTLTVEASELSNY